MKVTDGVGNTAQKDFALGGARLPIAEVVAQIADALDIHPFMLSRWRKKAPVPPLAGVAPKARTNSAAPRTSW